MDYIYEKDGQFLLDRYLEYIANNKDNFPINAGEFVFLPYHYDIYDRRCPHDSWVNCLNIFENGCGERNEKRIISIEARFINSFHDGNFKLCYKDVTFYDLEWSRGEGPFIGHGDWIIDETIMLSSGQVLHEIIFSGGGSWKIISEDISYSWEY